MCKSVSIAFSLLLFTGLAGAQMPAGNVFFGYSYYNTNLSPNERTNTNGWEASVEGRMLPWVGLVADFDAHYGSRDFLVIVPCPSSETCPTSVNADFTEHNYLFGPRVSVTIAKVRPFAEALFGAGHVNVNGINSDTSFATAVGGGFDYKLFPLLAWRVQGDYVHTNFFSVTQNNVRLSTGIVVHF